MSSVIRSDTMNVSRSLLRASYWIVVLALPTWIVASPDPAHNRTRITIMATSDFAGSFELNDEGSRGWSVLKTYSDNVKRNRRNAASRAFLLHTGDLTGLKLDPHNQENFNLDSREPVSDSMNSSGTNERENASDATTRLSRSENADSSVAGEKDNSEAPKPESNPAVDLLIRKGVDLMQYTGFDGVAIQESEERALDNALLWSSLLRFEYRQPESLNERRSAASHKILTGPDTFVWITAIEPAATLQELDSQIEQLRQEIYRNRAANLIVLLFAGNKRDSHDEMEAFQRITPEQWIANFTKEPSGNVFHPLDPAASDFPSDRILVLMPGKRAFFRTVNGMTVCRIPAGEICQIELDYRGNRKSITQHWIGFQEALRNSRFIPADPGMQKILRNK